MKSGFLQLEAPKVVKDVNDLLLFRDGSNEMAGEDPILFDGRAADRMMKAFEDQGVAIPVDYEHATLVRAPRGENAPAAGWITGFRYEQGHGLTATVEWTDQAKRQIAAGEYRYFSPAFSFDEDTRKPHRLHSVGLTNKPKTKRQKELLAASMAVQLEDGDILKTKTMKAQENEPVEGANNRMTEAAVILGKLGTEFPDGASEDAIWDAIMAALTKYAELIGAEAGAEKGAEEEVVMESEQAESKSSDKKKRETGITDDDLVKALKASDVPEAVMKLRAAYIPRAEHDEVVKRLSALENEQLSERIEAKLLEYQGGPHPKILTGDEEHITACRESAGKDFDAWVKFMDLTPDVYQAGRVVSTMAASSSTKSSRKGVIRAAREEYDRKDIPSRMPSVGLMAWVNQTLRDNAMTSLSESEAKEL